MALPLRPNASPRLHLRGAIPARVAGLAHDDDLLEVRDLRDAARRRRREGGERGKLQVLKTKGSLK